MPLFGLLHHSASRRALRRRCSGAALAAVAGVSGMAALTACNNQSGGAEVTIMAAASTRVLDDDAKAKLSEMTGVQADFVHAGSAALAHQLAEGAPGDVLITADQRTMDGAKRAGVVHNPRLVATNTMVVVVPKSNPAHVTGLDSSLRGAKVVACDPQVPCGALAATLIGQRAPGLPLASLEGNVTDTLGKVTSGQADAAFVYRTDARAAGDDVETIDIPEAGHQPNAYFAAVARDAKDPAAAQKIVDALDSEGFDSVWNAHGFTPSGTGR